MPAVSKLMGHFPDLRRRLSPLRIGDRAAPAGYGLRSPKKLVLAAPPL